MARRCLSVFCDVMPAKLPDLFKNDQLVLLGKYLGLDPVSVCLKGNYRGHPREFVFHFDLDTAAVNNAFVGRLWAGRKIAELIDAVRQMSEGATTGVNDPRMNELVDEIVRLSTEFGILTEYTAFLARDGQQPMRHVDAVSHAGEALKSDAIGTRSGLHAVSQSRNLQRQMVARLNVLNTFLAETMEAVSVANVQQVNDRAFYLKNGLWVDSRVSDQSMAKQPDRVVQFGTEPFFELVHQLARQNRQSNLAMRGDILLEMDGEVILVRMPNN